MVLRDTAHLHIHSLASENDSDNTHSSYVSLEQQEIGDEQ